MSSKLIPAPLLDDISSGRLVFKQEKNSCDLNKSNYNPLNIVIVGGSIGGLCTAIALSEITESDKDSAIKLHVFEKTTGDLNSTGAGLVLQPDMISFLEHFNVCDVKEISIESSGRQYLDIHGSVISGDDAHQFFSSWDCLYKALRRKIPHSIYNSGCRVIDITPSKNNSTGEDTRGMRVKILQQDTSTGTTHQYDCTADLIVGADGAGSLVRRLFCPDIESKYQGYVAWRGLVLENDVPNYIKNVLDSKFTVYQGNHFHFLAYFVPGSNGEVTPGKRRINWVWYENIPDDGQGRLQQILTDKNEIKHGYSVARGNLKAKISEEKKENAKKLLPTILRELVEHTEEIFVQAIHDLIAPHFVFLDGRVVLIGDSGAILRPHTAAGTTKAAVNAWCLAQCLEESKFDLKTALDEYDSSMRSVAEELVEVGVEIGRRLQFS